MSKNMVIAGDYKGKRVSYGPKGKLRIESGIMSDIWLTPENVSTYSLVDSEDATKRFSLGRAAVGGALLGEAGAVAGGLSSKRKRNTIVSVEFIDGKRSLLDLDGKLYQKLIETMYQGRKPDLQVEKPSTPQNPTDQAPSKMPSTRKSKWLSVGVFLASVLVLHLIACSIYPVAEDGTLQEPDWIAIAYFAGAAVITLSFNRISKRKK